MLVQGWTNYSWYHVWAWKNTIYTWARTSRINRSAVDVKNGPLIENSREFVSRICKGWRKPHDSSFCELKRFIILFRRDDNVEMDWTAGF